MMRISGGDFKNTRLSSPDIDGVRPTSEKMRQAVFNLLAHSHWGLTLRDSYVFDGFCGSGIMGLEALSRGATSVTFCDQDRNVIKALQSQIKALSERSEAFAARLKNTGFLNTDLCTLNIMKNTLSHDDRAYDLAFFDPPYHKDMMPSVFTTLEAAQIMKDGGLILFETEKEYGFESPSDRFTLLDHRIYGIGALWAWRYTKIPA
jgi:16S rRNA (guanine966-N2)-methyltransferase